MKGVIIDSTGSGVRCSVYGMVFPEYVVLVLKMAIKLVDYVMVMERRCNSCSRWFHMRMLISTFSTFA